MLPSQPASAPEPSPAPQPSASSVPASLGLIQSQVDALIQDLTLPPGAQAVGAELTLSGAAPRVRIVYASPRPFSEDVQLMVQREAARRLGLDAARVTVGSLDLGPRPLPLDTAEVDRLGAVLERYPRLRLAVTADTTAADSAAVVRVRRRFGQRGLAPDRVAVSRGAPMNVRLRLAPDTTAAR